MKIINTPQKQKTKTKQKKTSHLLSVKNLDKEICRKTTMV